MRAFVYEKTSIKLVGQLVRWIKSSPEITMNHSQLIS